MPWNSEVVRKFLKKSARYLIVLIVLACAAILIWRNYKAYAARGEPAVTSLSAYFVDKSGNPVDTPAEALKDGQDAHLEIRGEVYRAGRPVQEGKVRLTVSRSSPTLQQSVSVDLKDGRFDATDPAFQALRPGDLIHVTAEVFPADTRRATTAEIYLNEPPPVLTSTGEAAVLSLIAILIGVFAYAFTGKKTALKNRTAIIFSYSVIGIFLSMPLLAPNLLLYAFHDLRHEMNQAPVGLVVTCIGEVTNQPQWAVNIGGYATPATSCSTKLNASQSSPAAGQAAPAPQPAAPSVISGAEPSGSQPPGSSPASAAATSPGDDGLVDLHGGLVIPLYVIVLSIIGGAINMTRTVPRLQKEGEYSEVSPGRLANLLSSSLDRLGRWLSGAHDAQAEAPPVVRTQAVTSSLAEPTPLISAIEAGGVNAGTSPEENAKFIDDRLARLVKEQVARNVDSHTTKSQIIKDVAQMRDLFNSTKANETILNFGSFEDWMTSRPCLRDVLGSDWRVELSNQYMYLISAPFLAIVAYYTLTILGLTKMPIMVLISFSVGLISEKIVSWLLGMASGYLRGSAEQPAGGAGQAAA